MVVVVAVIIRRVVVGPWLLVLMNKSIVDVVVIITMYAAFGAGRDLPITNTLGHVIVPSELVEADLSAQRRLVHDPPPQGVGPASEPPSSQVLLAPRKSSLLCHDDDYRFYLAT